MKWTTECREFRGLVTNMYVADMVWLYVFVPLILWSRYSVTDSRRTPIVRLSSGPVRGMISRTEWNGIQYSSFKGIPYARPPLGDLRFKPPVPAERWKKVLNVFEEGNVCPQIDYVTSVYSGHEDCLYLNVYTQEVKFKRRLNLKPVMIWIHGGAYSSGYGNSALYGPDFFIEEDVVFVSFNYRLGVLGFLALNHPNATGNAGLKDQNLALRWVQSNIAVFGGDPNQVTLFGESAGSSSIGFHILSERSKGLFHRSISMSGTPLCPWAYHTPQELIHNAHQLAAILGFVPKDTNHLVHHLRQVPAMELVNATQRVALNILPFRPTVENPDIDPSNQTFLTECPITKYHTGDFHRHDMMMGYTHDEMILFLGPPIGVANAIAWAKRYLENVNKHHESVTTKPADIIAQLINTLVKNSFQDLLKIAMDIIFSGPIDLTQRLLAKQNIGHPLYYYRLSYQSMYAMHKINGNPLNGTAHFDDIGYIFNVKKLGAPTDPMDRFNRFRKKMVTWWTNFAKYGDPTPKNFNRSTSDVSWMESGNDGLQMDIDATSAMHNRLTDEKTENYERSLYRVLPLISSCVLKPAKYLDFF